MKTQLSIIAIALVFIYFIGVHDLTKKRQIDKDLIENYNYSKLLRQKNAQATINLILINKMTKKQLNQLKTDSIYLNLIDSL